MQGRAKSFRTAAILFWIAYVSPALHDVDLSTGRPSSVLKVPGHEPNGGPKPISLRQFCPDFDSAVGESEGLDGSEFSTDDGRQVIDSVGRSFASIIERCCAEISRRATPLFVYGVVSHVIGADLFFSEYWLDVEDGVVGIGGGAIIIINLELVIASTGHGKVMTPLAEVQLVEVVVEDQL
jgi:hypothetical protein